MQTDTFEPNVAKAQTSRWLMKVDGCFALLDGQERNVTPRGRKARAILAYLSTQPDVRVPRERVMNLLWGDRGEPQARNSLRQSLAEIRRLAGDLIEADRGHIWINSQNLTQDESEPARLRSIR